MFVGIAMVAVLLVVASVVAAGQPLAAPPKLAAAPSTTRRFHKPEFTLTDTSGHPYDFAEQTKGRLTLLYFGYTHCPD